MGPHRGFFTHFLCLQLEGEQQYFLHVLQLEGCSWGNRIIMSIFNACFRSTSTECSF
ncbi:hypothetical protein KC19_1G320500 [Ceratodon purpureus]|uniref:Uncharacterized protein n=1 Tax=Ceratodon purpureus TaxID=3225 RepID=A0A8T0JF62_CERPU|nr:hypothetical protein KC19_1G320500 [Ceratodon purpureus]